ncbi:MAG: TolC family protein [Planctomycetales bacterium]|nr:TolC family protein [Planctomycetales bacterium]
MPLGQLKRGSEDMVPAVKPDTEEPAIKLVSYETEPNELTLDVVTLLPAPEPDDTGSNEFHASPQWEDVADLLNPVYETGRELDADECYVQAMAATGLGHLIDIERQLHRCLKTTKRNATQKRIVDRLLCYRAEQERNRAAGESLETFYGLAEVESQKQLLDRTSKATNKLAQAAEGVKDSGIDAKIDLLGIELQQLEVKRRYSELQKNESTLQFNLRRLIGEAPGAPVQILPVVDWDAPDFTLTRDEAVQTAFEARAELKALNYLLSLQEKDALPSTRQQLRTNDASLGSGITGDKCLLKLLSLLFNNGDSEIEQCFRVRQLRELRAETVRLIEVEVSAAHFAVSNRLQILALAKAEADRRAEYISQIEAARTTGNYQYQDLADARIRLLAAEANVIHELYALRIDEAKLRQSQGLFCE